MPNIKKHLSQYSKNKELFNSSLISNPKYGDWKITIAFYSSLHLIESKLAEHEIHPPNHKKREDVLSKIKGYEEIYYDYTQLYKLSIKSRYNISIKDRDIKNAEICLKKIEEFYGQANNRNM